MMVAYTIVINGNVKIFHESVKQINWAKHGGTNKKTDFS